MTNWAREPLRFRRMIVSWAMAAAWQAPKGCGARQRRGGGRLEERNTQYLHSAGGLQHICRNGFAKARLTARRDVGREGGGAAHNGRRGRKGGPRETRLEREEDEPERACGTTAGTRSTVAARRGVGDSEERRLHGEERGVKKVAGVGPEKVDMVAVHSELDVVDDELEDGNVWRAKLLFHLLYIINARRCPPPDVRARVQRPSPGDARGVLLHEPDACGVLVQCAPAALIAASLVLGGCAPMALLIAASLVLGVRNVPCRCPPPRRASSAGWRRRVPLGRNPSLMLGAHASATPPGNDPGYHYPIRAMKERRDEEGWRKMRRFGLVFGLGEKSGIFESKTSRKNKINPGGKPVLLIHDR
ncbi:hypothetical protein DFH06DRAFT_1142792 [Mycena polygramma]|nr:hypothetical protein DFH06DRAFT_1142792 [Mycena polygramma]